MQFTIRYIYKERDCTEVITADDFFDAIEKFNETHTIEHEIITCKPKRWTKTKLYTQQQITTFMINTKTLNNEIKKYCLTQPNNITLDDINTHSNLTILMAIDHYQQDYITESELTYILSKIEAYQYVAEDKLLPLKEVYRKINEEIWLEELRTNMTQMGVKC